MADARNIVVAQFLKEKHEWLWFVDHDVVLPPTTIITWNQYLLDGKIPIFGGLYFTKSVPSEPLIYRGRGNSYFNKWKIGDKVWVDGMGLGNTLIHRSVLKVMSDESVPYDVGDQHVRRVFNTPSNCWFDPANGAWMSVTGTEDLDFYTRIIETEVLKRAGWKDIAKKQYPFLMDTKVFCRHIDNDGKTFPSMGEERAFVKDAVKQSTRGKVRHG